MIIKMTMDCMMLGFSIAAHGVLATIRNSKYGSEYSSAEVSCMTETG